MYLPPTIVCRVPQLPVHNQKLCMQINQVTVLLIDVVFFDANGQYEYVVLKCIKEEGRRFYKLVEVVKKPQEITCDCVFLEWWVHSLHNLYESTHVHYTLHTYCTLYITVQTHTT